MNTGFTEFIGAGVASMINKDLGILLKENKGDKIQVELDPDHPEKFSFPQVLWKNCIGGWLPTKGRKNA